jgi:hypothetical protein
MQTEDDKTHELLDTFAGLALLSIHSHFDVPATKVADRAYEIAHALLAKRNSLKDRLPGNLSTPQDTPPGIIEVRRNEDGTLDEIVAKNCDIHLEQMTNNVWWLGIYKNGYRQTASFYALTPIEGASEMDDWPYSSDEPPKS